MRSRSWQTSGPCRWTRREVEVSIANVFIVVTAILFGWRYAVPLAALSIGITLVVTRRPWMRVVFNVSMYAIPAWAAYLPVFLFGSIQGAHAARLTAYVLPALCSS